MAEWVLLKKWCEDTGDTPMAVHQRRAQGIWLDGKHCKLVVAPGSKRGRIWIHTPTANSWVQNGGNVAQK